MELSLKDAAVLLGVSPRTLRARAQRGEVPATKKGRAWTFDHRSLPLNDAQRARMQQRADEVRAAVEEVLPSRMARTRGDRERSLADLDAFRLGAGVLTAMRAHPGFDPHAADALEEALLAVAEAAFVFERDHKLEALGRARAWLGRAVARLLFAGTGEPSAAWVHTLEHEVQPAVSGLARWAAGLGRGR